MPNHNTNVTSIGQKAGRALNAPTLLGKSILLSTVLLLFWTAVALALPMSPVPEAGAGMSPVPEAGVGMSNVPVPADLDAPAVPGQFLIKFRPGTPGQARQAVVRPEGGRFFGRIAALDIDAVEFPVPKGQSNASAAGAILSRLEANTNIEFIEPNYIYTATDRPTDPGLGQQWGWNNIQALSAWDITRGNSATVIAVADTGIQRSHPDLDAKIAGGYDFVQGDTAPDDDNGHGTHVAGTAAAETNNGTGVAGMCPNCKLMPVRVLDANGNGPLSTVANGIAHAANNGAKVINLSLGGAGSETLQSAIDNAWNKGVFLACAAGNGNTSSPNTAYPGAYPNCFAVASTTASDVRSSFSNYGSWVQVAAPGSAIYSTWINNGYNSINGTSMATAHVAGLAGLLASQGLSNGQIRERICNTADKVEGTGTSWTCGRINAVRAVSGEQIWMPFVVR
jgi:subtilisin family serine protease